MLCCECVCRVEFLLAFRQMLPENTSHVVATVSVFTCLGGIGLIINRKDRGLVSWWVVIAELVTGGLTGDR